jgi:hypothetical protein
LILPPICTHLGVTPLCLITFMVEITQGRMALRICLQLMLGHAAGGLCRATEVPRVAEVVVDVHRPE